MSRESGGGENSFRARNPRKLARDKAGALFYCDDLVDRHICQSIDLPAGPRDFQRCDFRAFAESKMNPRIAGRHVTHPTLGLFDLHEAFGSELQRSADTV